MSEASVSWSEAPDRNQKKRSMTLRRCPGHGHLRFVSLSDSILGCNLHFYRNRTVPHIEPATLCEPCIERRPFRWRGYLVAWSPKNNGVGIVELTPFCVDPIEEYHRINGTLRGADIRLERPSGKPNGRVQSSVTASGIAAIELPKTIDLREALSRLWDIPSLLSIPVEREMEIEHGPGIPTEADQVSKYVSREEAT